MEMGGPEIPADERGEPLNVDDVRAKVASTAAAQSLDHWAGGAEDEMTLRDNRAAFERIRFWPRVLTGVGEPDQGVSLCGIALDAPLLVSPMGLHARAWPEGELATAEGVARAGCLLTLSAGSSRTLEDVATVPGERLFQVSFQEDRRVTEWLFRRAEAAGYRGLVVTVDAATLGRRERDMRAGFGRADVHFANYSVPEDAASVAAKLAHDLGLTTVPPSLTYAPDQSWHDLEWLRSLTALPVLVKGIIDPDDAHRAIGAGADAIWVSNHGGRQLDGTVATVDALPEVAARVAGRVPIIVDGGIRRGTDILKALARGATAVAVGRPAMWGLAYRGAEGVELVLRMLRDELRIAMMLTGTRRATDVDAAIVRG